MGEYWSLKLLAVVLLGDVSHGLLSEPPRAADCCQGAIGPPELQHIGAQFQTVARG